MQNFSFHTPTEIVFGRGAADKTAELVKKYGGGRTMLVYGGESALRSELIDNIERRMRGDGIEVCRFGGIEPNPTLEKAREGVAAAVDFGAGFVLAVGGGSAIDAAKAIAHGAANPGIDIWDFWTKAAGLKLTLPLGCVLTISAAGSETSASAVITNVATGEKRGLTSELNRPRFAVMDPALTFTVPRYHAACGIADIMMHTMERFFTSCKEPNETTDEIAFAVLGTVVRNGPKILSDPCDYNASSEIMWCGSLSHSNITGLGRPMDFSVHQMGHELSAKFGAAHGASLTSLWGAWAWYCMDADVPRFAYFARRLWDVSENDERKAAEKGIERTVRFFKSLGLPVSLPELTGDRLPPQTIKELAYACSFKNTRTIGSMKPLDMRQIEEVYTLANARH